MMDGQLFTVDGLNRSRPACESLFEVDVDSMLDVIGVSFKKSMWFLDALADFTDSGQTYFFDDEMEILSAPFDLVTNIPEFNLTTCFQARFYRNF
jgi:hypothetical protein